MGHTRMSQRAEEAQGNCGQEVSMGRNWEGRACWLRVGSFGNFIRLQVWSLSLVA